MPSSGLRDTEAVLRTLQHRLDLELSPQDVLALAPGGTGGRRTGQADHGSCNWTWPWRGKGSACVAACCAMILPRRLWPPSPRQEKTPGWWPETAWRKAQGREGRAARAVLGAGTGLGAALLVWTGRRWLPVPSEAGHAAFPFSGRPEHDFERFLQRDLGQSWISAEDVLSGQGLSQLHFFLSGEYLFPPVVGARALQSETTTLQWYARFLARFCRNWMYAALSLGGLWVCGGIAAVTLCV